MMAKKNTTSPAVPRRRAAVRKPKPTATEQSTTAQPLATMGERHRPNGGVEPTRDEIAEAAYYRHLKRGDAPGDHFLDWIEAERDLKNRR